MQPEQLILPTIATFALGTALLVPLRDDRLGKRATVGGHGTLLRWTFPIAAEQHATEPSPVDSAPAGEPVHEAHVSAAMDPEPTQEQHAAKRALSELGAAVTALGARVIKFFETPAQPLTAQPVATGPEPEHEVVTERSFAETLDALLPPSSVAEPLLATAPETVPLTVTPQTFPDRIVPLTRMPLRPQARELSWPRLVAGTYVLETAAERQAFLANAIRSRDADLEPALLAAYREEDAPGRLLALRALRGANCSGAIDAFADALHVGTDEERSVAVDALLAMQQLDAVTPAFNDRLDAIAAQAALGYVGSHHRADYVTVLEPFIDRARIETILALLAGIVE